MGEIRPVLPVRLICGIIACDKQCLSEAVAALEDRFGAIDSESSVLFFDNTTYYDEEMGRGLWRQFVSFRCLIDPGQLADIKVATNSFESRFAEADGDSLRRRVNLDPGYVTPSKLVMATTKNFSHRIYLKEGIYAEVTLGFTKQGVRAFEWTYPDYKSGAYDSFLLAVRESMINLHNSWKR